MQWSVVGHDEQKKLFERLLKSGALSHAYLFHGPNGIGKRTIAENIACVLLGTTTLAQNPDACVLMPSVDKETGKPTDIPVEAVRNMKTWAYQRPLYGSVKIVLIDDADRLGDAAANTLLKVLEEPPAFLHFFLITAVTGSVLPTIMSRCQDVSFSVLGGAETAKALAGLSLDDDDKKLLASVVSGRPGAARALVTADRVRDVARAVAGFERLVSSGMAERFVMAKTFATDDAAAEIVGWWLAWLHTRPEHAIGYHAVASALLELHSAVTEPKYNRRLAFERFCLTIPKG